MSLSTYALLAGGTFRLTRTQFALFGNYGRQV